MDRPDDEQREFDERLEQAREQEARAQERYVDGQLVAWSPLRGSQTSFLACPLFEALYHGTRGNGKSDALLMSFAQHVDRGHGPAWTGVLFRRTYPELADIVAKSERWFRQIFPSAELNRGRLEWQWPTGERLYFRHMRRHEDYWSYHGHEYPWIGWEELTNWVDDVCYRKMFACCRSSTPGVPRMIRATTNPYGRGHNWIKTRFRLAGRWRDTIVIDDAVDKAGQPEKPRASIHGHVDENKVLLRADPGYKGTIGSAATNESMLAAWLDGSWDVVSGGMFDDIWDIEWNVLPPFAVPRTWVITRAFDWGSSKPFSVGWYAKSDGSDLLLEDGRVMSTVRNDLFRIGAWYGWNGRPNEGCRALAVDVAKGIVEREIARGLRSPNSPRYCRVKAGPADSSIFAVENGVSIAIDMERPVRVGKVVYPGIKWLRADKRPGSRKTGWEAMRRMIAAAKPEKGMPRERPGLFVVGKHNEHFLRTVIGLPRSEKDPDDVDTDAEDHIADEVRYQCRTIGAEVRTGQTTGMH